MSIQREFVKAQFARLGQLSFPPKDAKELKELEAALMTAGTETMAKIVIDDWIRASEKWPVPANLYAVIDVLRERKRRDEAAQLPPWRRAIQCAECDDSGWRVVKRGVSEGVERCVHAKGAA